MSVTISLHKIHCSFSEMRHRSRKTLEKLAGYLDKRKVNTFGLFFVIFK